MGARAGLQGRWSTSTPRHGNAPWLRGVGPLGGRRGGAISCSPPLATTPRAPSPHPRQASSGGSAAAASPGRASRCRCRLRRTPSACSSSSCCSPPSRRSSARSSCSPRVRAQGKGPLARGARAALPRRLVLVPGGAGRLSWDAPPGPFWGGKGCPAGPSDCSAAAHGAAGPHAPRLEGSLLQTPPRNACAAGRHDPIPQSSRCS
jgi:hypothetical protein